MSFILGFLLISTIIFISKKYKSLINEINLIKLAKKNILYPKRINQPKTQKKQELNKNANRNKINKS